MKHLALLLSLLAGPLAAESLTVPGRWPEEKANQWYDDQRYFKKNRIAAYNWGLVAGKTQTQYPWSSWQENRCLRDRN